MALGSITSWSIVDRTTNALGHTVVEGKDAGGGLVQYVLDGAGKLVGTAQVLGK
jgi:hypothetical protein